MKKIAVITGSRADASPLAKVIELLGSECVHIQTEGLFGHEGRLLEILTETQPRMVVVLGDRYETLVAASVAAALCIPIAHLSGGDETEGANDNQFRHAITKLAYWHFPGTRCSELRLLRMGEEPSHIFKLGYPCVDNLIDLMSPYDLYHELGCFPSDAAAVMCWHPETLGYGNVEEIFEALDRFPDLHVFACGSNADAGGAEISCRIADWARGRQRATYRESYPLRVWLSLMKHSALCVGNSSAFVIEAPALGVPSVNVGLRQEGRFRAHTVINAACDADGIAAGINLAFRRPRAHAPAYEFGVPGHVTPAIVKQLLDLRMPDKPVKQFYE